MYKRQGLLPGRNEILRIRDSENGSIRLFFKNEQEYEEAYAVSYTHLDVYKRQIRCCVIFLAAGYAL